MIIYYFCLLKNARKDRYHVSKTSLLSTPQEVLLKAGEGGDSTGRAKDCHSTVFYMYALIRLVS